MSSLPQYNQVSGPYSNPDNDSKGPDGVIQNTGMPYPPYSVAPTVTTTTYTSPYFNTPGTSGYSQPNMLPAQQSSMMYSLISNNYFQQQTMYQPAYAMNQMPCAPPHSYNGPWPSHIQMQNPSNPPQITESFPQYPQQGSASLPSHIVQVTPKVKFYLHGSLGPDVNRQIRSVKQRLTEPIDCEEQFYENYITDYSKDVKEEVDESAQRIDSDIHENRAMEIAFPMPTMVSASKAPYIEPSLAQIRASVEQFEKEQDSIEDDSIATNGVVIKSEKTDEICEETGNGLDENWYVAAMKSYMENGPTRLDTNVDYSTCAIQGGRSDPDNPFAITSPSFSDSAAKAVLTTLQSDTATFVMISVMSIGSRDQLIPKIVNSKAAECGIISIANPDQLAQASENRNAKLDSQTNSIMAKLQRTRNESKEDGDDDNNRIDRLDITITIEDNQCIGSGDNKRWKCKLCEKSYTTKHNLVTHILDHGDIKPHLCLVCGKYFKQLSHLNVHMLTHDNVKPHVCPICNKGFTQISHLKRHEAVHTGSKPYVCEICNRGFPFPSELRLHKEKIHSDNDGDLAKTMTVKRTPIQDLKCKYCDRTFRFPSLLRDHLATHEGTRPHVCNKCGMEFLKEHHLKSHLFTHTGIRPFSCPECGRAFNQKANMQRHMLIHKAERSYKCEVCDKTFTQPQTLKAHMIVHSASKPHKCNICGKEFGRMLNLQGHLHVHNNSQPYKCSICQSSFSLKGNLTRHKKVKHGLDETTENMEVDAVKFLSSMSDRARMANADTGNGNEDDTDVLGEEDCKFVPNEQLTGDEEMGAEGEGENDEENEITYSDEEREIERRKIINEAAGDDEEDNGNTDDNGQSTSEQIEGQRPKRKRTKKYLADYTGYGDSDDEKPAKRKK